MLYSPANVQRTQGPQGSSADSVQLAAMLGRYLTDTPHPTDDAAEYGARTQSWTDMAGQWLGNAAGTVGSGLGTAAGAVGSGLGTAAGAVGSGIGAAAGGIGSAASAIGGLFSGI
jgi:hypothetical protein